MSSKRYPEEFRIEGVKQVTEKGRSVASVANRPGITTHSLYAWIKRYAQTPRDIKLYPMKAMKFVDAKKSYKASLKSRIY